MKKTPNFSLRIDGKILAKLHYIADYEGRSANKQIEQIIKHAIARFEREHGEIEVDKR